MTDTLTHKASMLPKKWICVLNNLSILTNIITIIIFHCISNILSYLIQPDQSDSLAQHGNKERKGNKEGKGNNALPGSLTSSKVPVPIPKVCFTPTNIENTWLTSQIITSISINNADSDDENDKYKIKILKIIGKNILA